MHWQQISIAATFHNAFAGIVNHYGALFGLFVGVAADVDKGFDDIVESVVVVIVDYQLAPVVVEQLNVLFFFFFVFSVVVHCVFANVSLRQVVVENGFICR